jgi:hypothetical protein
MNDWSADGECDWLNGMNQSLNTLLFDKYLHLDVSLHYIKLNL